MALQKDYKSFHLDLTGRLIKSLDKGKLIFTQEDRIKIDNFSSLKNIKYTDNGIIGVTGGMTKINSSALSYPKIRNMFHFNKSLNKESHVLVHAFSSAQTESKVFRNDTTIPNTGNFNATALHTDTGSTGSITAYAQNGLSVTVTSANHGLYTGDEVIITSTTSYNGVFKIDNVTLNTFDIVNTFIADDATGTWTLVLQGRFSAAPDEHAVYCNGKETMVYGGDKTQIARFEVIKIDESELYDYSNEVRNTLTDSDNLARLVQTPAANATLAKLLMHLDNNLTDSIGTHTPTGISITYDASNKVFGTHAGVFSGGAGVFISVPSHADFNISGGTFTFNARIRPTSLAANRGIFSHGLNGATTDYFQLYVDTAGNLKLDVVTAATGTLNLATTDTPIAINTFYDIKLCGTPNGAGAYNYYLFVDGALKVSSLGSAVVMIDLSASTHPVLIGGLTDGTTDSLPFQGQIDEVFFTNYYCLHTAAFTIPTSAYGTDTAVFMRLSNTMPIDAINFMIQVANATDGTGMVFYWNGNGWTTSGTVTDGTAASGKSLAQTGSMSFNSTATTAKQKMVDGIIGFYYLIRVANADAATRISNVTVRVPFQKLQDFWDGEFVPVASVQMLDELVFVDMTTNVLKDEFTYDSSTGFDESTYAKLVTAGGSNVLTSEYVVIGSLKRFTAVSVKMIPRNVNIVVATLIVERWNGAAWVKVKNLVDGTSVGGKSLANSGIVSWSSDEDDLEFKTKMGSRPESLYYIKFRWTAAIGGGNVFAYYIACVPAQRPIVNYKFPLFAQNRLWLFDKTEAIASSHNTFNVFNGKDSGDPFRFGSTSENVAAIELYTRTTTTSESVILVLKQAAIHLITGDNPEKWKIVDLSDVGCNAPLTLATSLIGFEFSALNRHHIAIWQSSGGIYMFDNTAVFPISGDISNYFDQTKPEAINLKFADKSYGFIETENGEHFYHWCFVSGATGTGVMTSSDGITWTARTSTDNDWRDVAWSPSLELFAAVASTGIGNRVMTSPDGITWTARTSASDNDWRAIAWSPELSLFAAVASSGIGNRVMTSPNGITWTSRTSASDNDWQDIAWSPDLNLFVAVASTGTGNRVMTSPDGIIWTSRTSATDNYWRAIAWSPSLDLFAAVASTGTGDRVMTSPDGITWTSRTSAADNNWMDIDWSPGLNLFVAVAGTGTVMSSPDGITWTLEMSTTNNWSAIEWSPELGVFVAVVDTGTVDALSVSLNWTLRTGASTNNWTDIAWSPELGLFAAVASSGTGDRVMTSSDGITWTSRTSAADNNWLGIAWSSELGLFAAVASSGTGDRVMTSSDGITWTSRTSAWNSSWRDIVWSSELSLFVAVAASTDNAVMSSPDGITWTSRTAASNSLWEAIAWSSELGLFAAVARSIITGGTKVMTSLDGITWTSRTPATNNEWTDIAWSPELGLFAAVASTGTGDRVMTSPNGITWTSRTSASDNDWNNIAWSPELSLFVAVAGTGSNDRVMTSPDGITWTAGITPTSPTSPVNPGWTGLAWSPSLGLFAAVASDGLIGSRVMTSSSIIIRTSTGNGNGIAWSPGLDLSAAAGGSGTASVINTEMIFDINRQKWFEVARGTGKVLQGGGSTRDYHGNMYTYGFEDNGYLQRLNNGTDFDGNSIVYEFEFGDILLTNDINMNTIIELLRLITVSKETTINNITVTHYGDTNDTGTDYTFKTARTGYRLAMPAFRIYTDKHILHRFKFTITTNDESGTGFEPLYIGGLYRLPEFAEDNWTD